MLARSFVFIDEDNNPINFDVFGSSLRAMTQSDNKELKEIGCELLYDFQKFSKETSTSEKVNLNKRVVHKKKRGGYVISFIMIKPLYFSLLLFLIIALLLSLVYSENLKKSEKKHVIAGMYILLGGFIHAFILIGFEVFKIKNN